MAFLITRNHPQWDLILVPHTLWSGMLPIDLSVMRIIRYLTSHTESLLCCASEMHHFVFRYNLKKISITVICYAYCEDYRSLKGEFRLQLQTFPMMQCKMLNAELPRPQPHQLQDLHVMQQRV